MRDTEDLPRARAAALAEELAAAGLERRPVEWLEELLVSALLEASRAERMRCAEVAAARARMWEASAERAAGALPREGLAAAGAWPREGLAEARCRRTEALAIADRILGPGPESEAGGPERAV